MRRCGATRHGRAAARGACSRSPCWPTCACVKAARDEAACLLAGIEDEAAALVPLVLCISSVATLPWRWRCSTGERRPAPTRRDRRLARWQSPSRAETRRVPRRSPSRLTSLAAETHREDLVAEADLAAGRAALALGDTAAAERRLEAAAGRFAVLRDAATRRRELGSGSPSCTRDSGRRSRRAWPAMALIVFERLDARPDADQAAALLRRLGGPAARPDAAGATSSPRREREVLRLVAAGLSNGQIAEQSRDRAEDRRAPRQPGAGQARRAQPRGGGRARRARGRLPPRGSPPRPASGNAVAAEDAVGVVAALDGHEPLETSSARTRRRSGGRA